MEILTVKLEKRQAQRLKEQARASGRSQAAVLRELIDKHLGGGTRSLHDLAGDLCGSMGGGKDLSTRRLRGYGRD